MTDYVLGFDQDYTMPQSARAALASSSEFLDVYALKGETQPQIDDLVSSVADTRTYVDAQKNVGVSLTYKQHSSGAWYSVLRVNTHGRFVPGLVGKEFAFDYQDAGTSGVNFKPVLETLDSAWSRYGAPVLTNGSGVQTSGNTGEIRGAQIRDGIKYHDMSMSHWQEMDSIGILGSGAFKMYSARWGDTTQDMLDDGVVDSFSFGPALVVDGVVQDIGSDPIFAGTATVVSARSILGQSQSGDVIRITAEGITGTSGLLGSDMPQLAADEGCYQAVMLDGGGSAQMFAGGVWAQPSSDAGQKRAVADFVTFNVPQAPVVDTGWRPITLASGYAVNGTDTPSVRQLGGDVRVKGQVKPATGTFGTGTVVVGTLPNRFWNSDPVKPFQCLGDAENARKVFVTMGTGAISVAGSTANPAAYLSLTPLGWLVV